MSSKHNILLLTTPVERIVETYDLPDYPHIGIGYLTSYLIGKGISVSVVDTKLERLSCDDILSRLSKEHFDYIGISSMTHEVLTAAKLAKQIKEIRSSAKIILGGVHASALPVQALEEFPGFDITVAGEGEEILYEIISGKPSEEIKGIAFRDSQGKIILNEARGRIQDLDSLPFPAWDKFPRCSTYHIMTARGCPYNCVFCMSPYGRMVRERSVKNVTDEIKLVIERYDPKCLKLNDETFGFNKERACGILDFIIKNGLSKTPKFASMRADRVDLDILKKMERAGFVYIDYGVESGNAEILKRIKKGVTLEQTQNAIKLTKEAGIKVGADYILGHPGETLETARQTIDYAVKLNADVNCIGIMVPFPGTEVYELAKKGEGGYVILSHDWSAYNKQLGNALELKNINRKALERLQLMGYLKILIYNFRVLDLIKFIIKHRKAGMAFLINYLKK